MPPSSVTPASVPAAPARRRLSLVRRAATVAATQGPRKLIRVTWHSAGWRWRRRLKRFRASEGLMRRRPNRPSRTTASPVPAAGPASMNTPAKATASLARAETLLLGMRAPVSTFAALPKEPTVGIVVPAFRDSAFLADALQTVCDQSYPHWRCIVVDDASPEDIAGVVKPFRLTDSRIRLARHGSNGGLPASRNTGLRLLDTDMVLFLDADDMLVPSALQHAVDRFATLWPDPAVAGVHGQVVQVPEETDPADMADWGGRFGRRVVDWTRYTGECPFNVHSVVLRRSLLDACGGFDETLRHGAEDWDLWFRLLRHGYRFEPTHHLVGAYRQHRTSMFRTHQTVHLQRANGLYDAAEEWARLDPALTVGRGAAAPLSQARLAHERAKRAASVISMQIASSGSLTFLADSDAFELLDTDGLAEGRWTEIVEAARNGAARGLGLSRAISDQLTPVAQDRILRISHAVAEEVFIRSRVSDRPAPYDATLRGGHADVLMLAESAADVEVLAPIAAELADDLSVACVDMEIVSGTSGANDAWRQAGVDILPYHHVVGSIEQPAAIVACAPVGPIAMDLLSAAATAGANCQLVRVAGRPATLPCNAGVEFERITVSRETVVERVRTQQARGRAQRARRLRWRGSDFSTLLPFEDGPHDPDSVHKMVGLRDRHLGETAVIVGNGPSLNDTELEILTDVPTFGVNAIFLAADRFPKPITYYVVEDTSVFKENVEAIKAFPTEWKLFPAMYRPSFEDSEIDDHTVFFRMNAGFYDRKTGTTCHPRFSFDATQRLYCGQSVTIINLQLAHWMGFQRVVLIGMDFSYSIPDDVDRDGALIISRSDDPNHFHPGYFGPGKSWKDPLLDRVLVSYHLADEVYRASGREIVNATEGGKLDIFPRMPLREALGPVSER